MEWWKEGVFYQIYPRSFKDSNGDGIGDLNGVKEKLDYFKWLEIDALWICPFFKSPMADFGYDISDYTEIDPIFGNMEDFKELLKAAHKRNIRIIIDQVYNHTSDEHPWFVESKSSRHNPKSDWYIWKDPKPDGTPPNNWISLFSGETAESAWTWDENRKQYYLHLFAKAQPDLNWQNVEVREAIYDSMRFWLDLGVDGFRFDASSHFYKALEKDLIKGPQIKKSLFESSRDEYYWDPFTARPETLIEIEKIRKFMDSYQDKVSIGEISSDMGLCLYLMFTIPGRFNIAFNIDFLEKLSFNASNLRNLASTLDAFFGSRAWPSYVTGNHDNRRILSRMIDGMHVGIEDKKKISKLFATMLLTLRGTPFIYYGEEIGMEDTYIPREKIMDPWGKALWPKPGRDPSRTPMQWDSSRYAGFSNVDPWLPINENKSEINVKTEMDDPDSVLNFYKKLIHERKKHQSLRTGTMQFLNLDDDILAYKRESDYDMTVILNFSDKSKVLNVNLEGQIILSNYPGSRKDLKPLEIRPFESMIIKNDHR